MIVDASDVENVIKFVERGDEADFRECKNGGWLTNAACEMVKVDFRYLMGDTPGEDSKWKPIMQKLSDVGKQTSQRRLFLAADYADTMMSTLPGVLGKDYRIAGMDMYGGKKTVYPGTR